jgi:hypothetical protein
LINMAWRTSVHSRLPQFDFALPRPDSGDEAEGQGGNYSTRSPATLLAFSLGLSALLVALVTAALR